jgi:hypothetical protein
MLRTALVFTVLLVGCGGLMEGSQEEELASVEGFLVAEMSQAPARVPSYDRCIVDLYLCASPSDRPGMASCSATSRSLIARVGTWEESATHVRIRGRIERVDSCRATAKGPNAPEKCEPLDLLVPRGVESL